MKVQVLLVKPHKHPFPILSWLIRLVQRVNYSHMAISYMVDGQELTIDSTSKGVREMLTRRFLQKYAICNVYEVNLNVSQKLFKRWLNAHKGKFYSPMQIIGLLLMMLKIVKTNPWGHDSNRLTCNELVLLMISKFTYHKGLADLDDYDLAMTEQIIKEVSK